VEQLTFPLSVGATARVTCSLLYGGAYTAGSSEFDLVGDQNPQISLNFGARSIAVTKINIAVAGERITKSAVRSRSFNVLNRSLKINCLGSFSCMCFWLNVPHLYTKLPKPKTYANFVHLLLNVYSHSLQSIQ